MEASYPKSILTALHAIMEEVGYVQKKGRNDFHKYRYAGEADLLQALRPAMLKHGLVLIPSSHFVDEPDQHGNTHVQIDYTLAHTDGSVWPDKVSAIGSGNDKNSKGGVGDKGAYKAITGANKYLLFKLFQIETGDDPEVASEGDKGGTPKKDDKAIADEWMGYAERVQNGVRSAADQKDLMEMWKAEATDLAVLKLEAPETYQGLVDAFSARKKELTGKAA